MSDYVELSALTKTYPTPKGPAVIVQDFDLRIRKGEFVTLIGHSGCGKSTVLTMLAGLNEISDGGVIVGNREIDGAGPDRAVVFQSPCLMPWMTAFGNVMLGVKNVYPHASKAERKQIVEYALASVGLADSMDKRPREMSGGMQQRVGIARAFSTEPDVLFMDEPFSHLDAITARTLRKELHTIWAETGKTVVFVTHDVGEAVELSNRILVFAKGGRLADDIDVKLPFPRDVADSEVALMKADVFKTFEGLGALAVS